MEDDKNEKDRQLIEDYVQEHAIEQTLDEVINNIVERRPVNPYVELSKLLESKTKPEIVEVQLTSILAGCSTYGVRATLLTNVGTFIGLSSVFFRIFPISFASSSLSSQVMQRCHMLQTTPHHK
jgi:hypothetical protein